MHFLEEDADHLSPILDGRDIRENMRLVFSVGTFLLIRLFVSGQELDIDWYSESTSNGVTIQNSFPKGGPYTGPTRDHFNHSYLVFFTRVLNETENPLELSVHFSSDSIPIPNSPDTFVKIFLPQEIMTIDKYPLFSYGITELESLDRPTRILRKIDTGENCLFYVVAFFYQTKKAAWRQERGGNRAELVMKGQNLFYRMTPQVDYLPCGQIVRGR